MTTVGAPIELLQRVPLFANLDRRELEWVARHLKERRFAAGETVMREGTGGAVFFLIDSGTATVSVKGSERARLTEGDHFGELALIDEGVRSASVVAATELVCWGLTVWDLQPLVEQNGKIGWKLLQTLARRLRDAGSQS